MSRSELLVSTLKKALKTRGITYRDLAKRLRMSEAAMKRAFAQGGFTLKRLDEICIAIVTDLRELCKTAYVEASDVSEYLSRDQEEALASDESLFAFFYTLLAGYQPRALPPGIHLNRAMMGRLLSRLEKVALIERHPHDQVRVLVPGNVRWIPAGPLQRRYGAEIKKEFVSSDFSGTSEDFRLLMGCLSDASLKIFSTKFEKLLGEFVQMAEADGALPREQTTRIWLMGAYRPWLFSKVANCDYSDCHVETSTDRRSARVYEISRAK